MIHHFSYRFTDFQIRPKLIAIIGCYDLWSGSISENIWQLLHQIISSYIAIYNSSIFYHQQLLIRLLWHLMWNHIRETISASIESSIVVDFGLMEYPWNIFMRLVLPSYSAFINYESFASMIKTSCFLVMPPLW